MDALLLLARLALAAVFLVAGAAKLVDLPGSIAAMRGFGIPERLTRPMGLLLPVAELMIALLLLPNATALVSWPSSVSATAPAATTASAALRTSVLGPAGSE